MKKRLLIFIVFILFLAVGIKSQQRPPGTEAKINALNQYMDESKLIASGNVEVAWEDYRIYADYLEFNQETKEIVAVGRVTMSSKDTVITGEKLRFNLRERTGEMHDTYGQLPPTVRYTTDKLNQVDNDTLTFNKLDFTSCTQCVPRWNITCTNGKIKKEKYIEMKNILFKIKKIPVFYLPYLRYPIKKDGRATGFLIPKFGTSSVRGFFFLNAFFWPIKSNVDLTLHFDYYAKAGIGVAQELRYLTRHMNGDIEFYFFKYKQDNILDTEATSDYYLKMEHKQRINFLNTRITASIDRQSDANFLRLFSNNFDAVLRRISRSSISLDSSFSNFKISFSAMQNDTFYTFANRSTSVRYFPQVKLNWNQQKIWKLPGYFSLAGVYSTVSRVGKTYEEDEAPFVTDVTSTRLSLTPTYSLNLIRLPWLSANLALQSKYTYYPKSRNPTAKGIVIVDEPLTLHYSNANVTLKGPAFSRIFESRNSKLKHVIEPKIIVRYVTKVDDEDLNRLIPVDYFDYPSYSYVGFSLSTRLLYKSKKRKSSPRELLSLTVQQDYYFDPQLASRGRKIEGEYPEFSQLENILRLRPFQFFRLDASLFYNHYLDKFTRVRLSVGYRNKDSFINGDVFYNNYINQYARPDYILNRESIGGFLDFDIPRFPVKFRADVNYDITDKQFRLGSFRVRYDYQCIQLNGELKLFKYRDRLETQFNVGVSFGNMGMVRDFLGIEK